MAISYSISYTFSPSTTISSSQVNQNFTDNANTWTGLEAKTKTFSNLGIDTQLKSGGTVESGNGTAGAPSITFGSDTATGFYRSASTIIGVGTGNKITGLANGTAATDAANYGQLKVLQTVTATSTTDFSTGNAAFQSTNLTASITPTSASNRILIIVTGSLSQATQNNTSYLSISRGGTNIGAANGFTALFSVTGGNTGAPAAIVTIDSPATTSSTGYTVTLRVGGGTGHFGVNSETQTIVLMEIV